MNYAEHYSTKKTPQSELIPGSKQVANSAGGFSFVVDDWMRLHRFLILGAEGGSYYATERKLTIENADAVKRCIKTDGLRTVRTIVEISDGGRAPKNDPAIFALAMCAKLGDDVTRKAAYEALPKVCRIGTHLFHFAEYAQAFGGWGRGMRRAVARWYDAKPVADVAHQVVKYQGRDGWTNRDLLRLSKPKKAEGARDLLYRWVTKGWEKIGDEPAYEDLAQIWAFERLKAVTDAKEAARIVREHRLPRECVPTSFLNDAGVWDALLEHMKPEAMIRNLGKMTEVGLLKPLSKHAQFVSGVLSNAEALRRARLHPIKVLAALLTYRQGHGVRGSLVWEPVGSIVDALDAAFYLAFGAVEPSGKRTLLALDVSGSMDSGEVAGVPGLSPRVGSAAMALVTAATEKEHAFIAFTSGAPNEWVCGRGRSQYAGYRAGVSEVLISPKQRLDDVCAKTASLPMGGTDCALPMLWALDRKVEVDVFITYTDSESWAGEIHAVQALQMYRDKMGIPARAICVGMVANEFSVLDPSDAGSLDVVGFDTATPELISMFSAGKL